MLIPSKQANLIRKVVGPLFTQPEGTKKQRIKVFYKLIRPLLSWLKEDIINTFGLEPAEAESEIYLFCAILFNKYNFNKSSIIPYLSKYIGLLKTNFYRKLHKQSLKEIPSGLINQEESEYELNEEWYYTVPNILFEDRYIGKLFTFDEKYVIYVLLMSDNNELNLKQLAINCNIDKRVLSKKLNKIAYLLKEKEVNATNPRTNFRDT